MVDKEKVLWPVLLFLFPLSWPSLAGNRDVKNVKKMKQHLSLPRMFITPLIFTAYAERIN